MLRFIRRELNDLRNRAERAEQQRDAALARLAFCDAAHEQELARKQAAAEGRADARAAAERMKEQLADIQSRGTAPRMNWFLGGPGLRTCRRGSARRSRGYLALA
jgi:hypothetical protein